MTRHPFQHSVRLFGSRCCSVSRLGGCRFLGFFHLLGGRLGLGRSLRRCGGRRRCRRCSGLHGGRFHLCRHRSCRSRHRRWCCGDSGGRHFGRWRLGQRDGSKAGQQDSSDQVFDIRHVKLTHQATVASAPTVISEPEFRSGLDLQRRHSAGVDGRYFSLQIPCATPRTRPAFQAAPHGTS